VTAAARRLSGYHDPGAPDGVALFMGRYDRPGYVIERYILHGEGGYPIPLLLLKPDDGRPHPAVLYLDPAGKAAHAAPGGELEWLVRQGYAVAAPDLLGDGEMGPGDFKGDSYHFADRGDDRYGFWFGAVSAGRSIAGIQAADLVRVARWLGTRADVSGAAPKGIARGELGSVLLHAAAFEPAISGVALIGGLDSYDDLVHTRDYRTRFIPEAVPEMLTAYDLPDLEAALAPRPVLLLNPVNAAGVPLPGTPRFPEEQVHDALRAWLSRSVGP
jgi:hypothetical protein